MNKAKHAFGNSSGIEAALQSGKINDFDILFLDSETDPKVGWIKDGKPVIIDPKADLSGIEAELATKATAEKVEALESQIAAKVDAEDVQAMIKEHSKSVIEVVEF